MYRYEDVGRRLGGSCRHQTPLLELERIELELYRFVDEVGVGRGRSTLLPSLAVRVGCTEYSTLTELLKELRSLNRIYLGKYFGQLLLSYEQFMEKIDEGTFFYSGNDLFIKVLGRGRRRQQRLQQRQANALRHSTMSQQKPTEMSTPEQHRYHPEIERVSGALFRNGHYKHAALEAYIRVITAVREKSGLLLDGDDLMGRAFGSQNHTPAIQFNRLQTQAERDRKSVV